MRDVAGGNLFANESTGNDFAVAGDGCVDDDFKAVAHAEFAKEFDVAELAMSEMEIIADDDGAYL